MWKKNALFELIKLQGYYIYGIVDKIHLYVKDPNQSKKQYLIKKREKKWSWKSEKSEGFEWIYKQYAGCL